jgi:hypothetical protein
MGDLALGERAVSVQTALCRGYRRAIRSHGGRYDGAMPDAVRPSPLQVHRAGFGREAARVALPNDPAMFKHVDAVGVG